jgi:hypothetical protein
MCSNTSILNEVGITNHARWNMGGYLDDVVTSGNYNKIVYTLSHLYRFFVELCLKIV